MSPVRQNFMSICVICDKEIPEARLKIFPKTNLCGRKCGEEIEQKHEILQKENTKIIKIFGISKIMFNQIIN